MYTEAEGWQHSVTAIPRQLLMEMLRSVDWSLAYSAGGIPIIYRQIAMLFCFNFKISQFAQHMARLICIANSSQTRKRGNYDFRDRWFFTYWTKIVGVFLTLDSCTRYLQIHHLITFIRAFPNVKICFKLPTSTSIMMPTHTSRQILGCKTKSTFRFMLTALHEIEIPSKSCQMSIKTNKTWY